MQTSARFNLYSRSHFQQSVQIALRAKTSNARTGSDPCQCPRLAPRVCCTSCLSRAARGCYDGEQEAALCAPAAPPWAAAEADTRVPIQVQFCRTRSAILQSSIAYDAKFGAPNFASYAMYRILRHTRCTGVKREFYTGGQKCDSLLPS